MNGRSGGLVSRSWLSHASPLLRTGARTGQSVGLTRSGWPTSCRWRRAWA